ncbi:hypothetical protein GQ600_13177 [Phytophthora cactorum]|nr:hypothetical protein GQ600_13177 [Phytophthora cactorum]
MRRPRAAATPCQGRSQERGRSRGGAAGALSAQLTQSNCMFYPYIASHVHLHRAPELHTNNDNMDKCGTTASRTQKLKKQLVKEYECDCGRNQIGDSMLLCMVMNIGLPSSVVIASHIFRREHDRLKDYFSKLLVDSLTQKQWDALGGESIPTDWETSTSPVYAPYAPEFNVLTTFGELDGKPLRFPSGSTLRPFRRCLYHQAQLARTKALSRVGCRKIITSMTSRQKGSHWKRR